MAKIKIRLLYRVIFIILIGIIFIPGYIRFIELKLKNDRLEREIERLEKENIKLHKEKKRLEEDMVYVEKIARESMGVTRKGEIPIRIK